MKKETQSVFALFLTILGVILTGVTAYLLEHIPLVWKISAGVTAVAAAGYVFLELESFKQAFSKRGTKYGLNVLVSTMLVAGIVVVVNMIAINHDVKKDLTKNKLHTLSEQSVKVISGLKSEVRMRAFVNPNQIQEFDAIFGKFTYHSKLLKKEYVDVDKEPFAVQKYNVKQAGTIIFETENRTARVENLFGADDPKVEEKVINAIIQCTKGDKKKIYFLTGHGERMLSDSQREGYSEIKETLENGRYKVEELSLLDKDKVPADAEIMIVAGPKSDFMEHELKLLETYVRFGGKLLFMVEPNSSATIKPFLAKFGADWNPKKAILETNRLQQLAGGNPLTPIVTTYDGSHEITHEAKQLSIFPISTPVEKAKTPPQGYNVTSLFSTSARSLEAEVQGDKVKVDEKTDRKGPLSLAVAISGKAETQPGAEGAEKKEEKKDEKAAAVNKEEPKKDTEFRMVVVGDSDFAANATKRFGINADIFQNMLSWLSKEEDLISIRPRSSDTSEFEITEERVRVINLASIVVAPFGMFISGIAMWLSRRRR